MLDRQIAKNVKVKTALGNKNHKDHKKAKGLVKRFIDKFRKKESVNEIRKFHHKKLGDDYMGGYNDAKGNNTEMWLAKNGTFYIWVNQKGKKDRYIDLPKNIKDRSKADKIHHKLTRGFKNEDIEEGFGGELKGADKKKFEKARKENAEVLGYKLTGKSDIRESIKSRLGEKALEGEWEVYNPKIKETIKVVKSSRAATRLMNRLMSSGKYNEIASRHVETHKNKSVNESNPKIDKIKDIVKKKSYKRIGGVIVDMQTANAILKVHKALNAANRKKYERLPISKMADVAWKLMK